MSASDQEQNPSGTLLRRLASSEALLLAIIPIAGYLVLYYFQAGYLSYYGLPSRFISFKLIDVLVVSGNLLLYGLLGLTWLWLVSPWVVMIGGRVFSPALFRLLFMMFALVLFYVGLGIFFYFRARLFFWVWLAGFVSSFLLLPFLKRKGVTNRTQIERIMQDKWKHTHMEIIWKHLVRGYIGPASIYLFTFLFLTFIAGAQFAARQDDYLVVNTTPEMVVLFMTEDRAIVSPFDRDAKEIERSFMVIQLDDADDILFVREEVGPLRLERDLIVLTPTP